MEKLLKKKSNVNRKETKSSVRAYCTCEEERGTYESSDILVLVQFVTAVLVKTLDLAARFMDQALLGVSSMHDWTKLFELIAKLGDPKRIVVDSIRLVQIPTCTRKDCGEPNICVGGSQTTPLKKYPCRTFVNKDVHLFSPNCFHNNYMETSKENWFETRAHSPT